MLPATRELTKLLPTAAFLALLTLRHDGVRKSDRINRNQYRAATELRCSGKTRGPTGRWCGEG